MKKSPNTQKTWLFLVTFVAIFLVAYVLLSRFITSRTVSNSTPETNITVMASFYPLYYFASQVGQNLITVETITPYGSEPHDYEPTPQQLTQLETSQILLLNGGGFEPWAERVAQQLAGQPIQIVRTAEQIKTISEDPHVWLSPRLAQIQVQSIAAALSQADPDHQSQYQDQAFQLNQKLQALDQEFTQSLSQCTQRQFVTSHDAFGYLAQEYNLEQVSIAGLSPDEEPSSRTLTQLADYITQHSIKYIFFETLVSPKLAQTLAQETGAQTLVLDPIEGLSQNQAEAGETYFTVMRRNLSNLRLALACQ